MNLRLFYVILVFGCEVVCLGCLFADDFVVVYAGVGLRVYVDVVGFGLFDLVVCGMCGYLFTCLLGCLLVFGVCG